MLTQRFETVNNTNLFFLYQTRTRSQFIYSLTLLVIVITLGALPFIYTTISINSKGIINCSVEKTELFAPVSGYLIYSNLKDNQKVTKGSTLLKIDCTLHQQQTNLLVKKISQLKLQLKDAEELIDVLNQPSKRDNYIFKTKLYHASWQQYVEQFQNVTNTKQQAERMYLRYQILYSKNVVTLSEFEQYKFNFEQALSNQRNLNKKYINQWQIEVNQNYNELQELQWQQDQLSKQVKQYNLKATLNGSIQNLTGLQEGSYVYVNQKLGEISPDNILFAYCYVKPSDIGLLKKGQIVRFQIDAFDYNQWGILTGKISDISEDVIMQGQSHYFKIKCKLDRDYLQLKNGYLGYIKKGMTLRASFVLAKRSLYQLAYTNINNWINAN